MRALITIPSGINISNRDVTMDRHASCETHMHLNPGLRGSEARSELGCPDVVERYFANLHLQRIVTCSTTSILCVICTSH